MCFSTFGPICLPLHIQKGSTPLCIASQKGHSNIVEELLRREADVNHQTKVKIHIVESLSCLSLLLCVQNIGTLSSFHKMFHT